MNMDIDDLKDRLLEFCNILCFEYNGFYCGVDPYNPNLFDLYFNGNSMKVHSIDEVFSTPYFDGKTLKDIIPEIEITEW